MALSTKTLVLGAYFSLRAEALTPEDMPTARQQITAFYHSRQPEPAAMAAKTPKPLPSQTGTAHKARSLIEMKRDEDYPDMYDIVMFKSAALKKSHACEILGRFFGKDIGEACEIFNQVAERQYSFINEKPYSLDVAETKLGEVRKYARDRRMPVPLMELRKF